jgi:polyisoprenoid-binding protein YceI
MKNLVFAALLIGGSMFGQTKKVTNSNVQWWGYKIAKTEASSHNGNVDVKSGEVMMKGSRIVGGTFSLDMSSINATDLTGESQTKLNNHLKNGDFFETDKFPNATYTITSVKKNANKAYPFMIYGNLTAKDKTNPVSFPAKINLNNGILNIVSDKFGFDRQKFGIAYASLAKDVVIKDEIDMMINITAK